MPYWNNWQWHEIMLKVHLSQVNFLTFSGAEPLPRPHLFAPPVIHISGFALGCPPTLVSFLCTSTCLHLSPVILSSPVYSHPLSPLQFFPSHFLNPPSCPEWTRPVARSILVWCGKITEFLIFFYSQNSARIFNVCTYMPNFIWMCSLCRLPVAKNHNFSAHF